MSNWETWALTCRNRDTLYALPTSAFPEPFQSLRVIEIAAEDIPQPPFLSGRIHSIRMTTTTSSLTATAAARAMGEESIMKGSTAAAGDRPRD